MSVSQGASSFRVPIIKDIALFFRFLGHLAGSIKDALPNRMHEVFRNCLSTVYYSGVKMVIPLMLICSLMGASLIFNIYQILSPLYMQNQVLMVAQNILFYDLLPFIIGLVLSIQLALNIVSAHIEKLQRTPHEVMLQIIMPMILGCNLSALLLYIYSLNAILISIYFCFHFLLKTDLHEYLFHLTNTMMSIGIFYSILKTLIYCTIVSLIVGYYYYTVASAYLTLRQAISRILTRSLLCLTISSIYFKFFSY